MKLNRLETHDRLEHFKKDQGVNIFKGAEDCLKRNKDAISMQEYFPYIYIFAHPRTADDGVTKRMLWQPRLSKPKAQDNSYLFRSISGTDIVEVIWMIPPREMWPQYEKGKMFESEDVMVSIKNFVNNKEDLEKPHDEDWSEEKINKKLHEIASMQKGFKPVILEAF
jgi:hypothetical protein